MSTRSIHYRRASLGDGTTAACGTITSSMTAEPAEVTCKRCLKMIDTGSAESGYLAGSKLNKESTDMSDKKLDLIAQVLAKAESTTPEEAEALTEHAERLMVKYGIDQAKLNERRAKAGQASEQIVQESMAFTGAYRGEMVNLGAAVAYGLGSLRVLQSTTHNKGKTFVLYIIGFESDVKQAITLINSLQVQSAVAVRAWWKLHKDEYAGRSTYDQEKARRSFVHGFGSGAGNRIRQSRVEIVQEASKGTEMVLASRDLQVQAHLDSMQTRKGRARTATGSDGAAVQGYRAGQQANTGGTAVSQGRGVGA